MRIELLNKTYDESLKIKDTKVGEKTEFRIEIFNTFDTHVGVECIPQDKDVHVISCPKTLEAKKGAIVILEYAPKTDRDTTLKGSLVEFKTSV